MIINVVMKVMKSEKAGRGSQPCTSMWRDLCILPTKTELDRGRGKGEFRCRLSGVNSSTVCSSSLTGVFIGKFVCRG